MRPQQTLKPPSLNTIIRGLFFFTLAGSITISGIIRPLLVQCTPADGRTVIELIGQDPHHQTHSEHFCELSKNSPDVFFSSGVDDCGSCVDRVLNHTAILRIAPCNPLQASIWGAFETLSGEISPSAPPPVSHLLPDSALQAVFHLQFKQPLLI